MKTQILSTHHHQTPWFKQKTTVLVVSTVVLGMTSGVGALVLSFLLEHTEQLFLRYGETAKVPAPIATMPLVRLLSVVLGGLIAAVIWWFLRTKTTPTISVNKALDGGKMPLWQTLLHDVTQIFYVGTGGSVGRELAPREVGAVLAEKWTAFLARHHIEQLSSDDRRLLIAAAAGAGFAGIYIAPITGMFFAVEILYKKYDLKTVGVSLTMSTIAMGIGSLVKGFNPYYLLDDVKFPIGSVLFVIVLAPLCGMAGSWFRKCFQWAEKHQTKTRHILWQLPLASLLTGSIAYFFPEIMGNGRALAQLAIGGSTARYQQIVIVLIVGAGLKAIVTVLTIRSGASGGTLTPSISIGGALGAVAGWGLAYFVPGVNIGQGAILGAGTLLAASQQAPLMAMFMLIEITHLDGSAILPLALGILIATAVSRRVLQKKTSKKDWHTTCQSFLDIGFNGNQVTFGIVDFNGDFVAKTWFGFTNYRHKIIF